MWLALSLVSQERKGKPSQFWMVKPLIHHTTHLKRKATPILQCPDPCSDTCRTELVWFSDLQACVFFQALFCAFFPGTILEVPWVP